MNNTNKQQLRSKTPSWIKLELMWGIVMFVTMSIIFPLIMGKPLWSYILVGIPIYSTSAFLFGYFFRRWAKSYRT